MMSFTTKPALHANRSKLHGSTPLFAIRLCALLLVCFTPGVSQINFDKYEVVTGPAKHQTNLTESLLGGTAAEFAVIQVSENGDRRLRIYTFDGVSWRQKLDHMLRPEVLFVDVARIGARDRLLTFEPGRLNFFDADSGAEHPLVEVASRFNAPVDGEIPRVYVARDLNDDDLDDLVIPGSDGFQIYVQQSDGTFSDPLELGPPEPFLDKTPFGLKRTYGEIGWNALTNPLYQNRVHTMDYNRDGRSDLVFWNKDHFDLYLQDGRGRFPPAAETFKIGAAFDFDGAYSVFFRTGEEKRLKYLHSFQDMNGDRIADLLLISQKSIVSRGSRNRRRLSRGARFELHFGKPIPGGTMFASKADTSIKSRGFLVGLRPHDLNRDGQVDMMLTNFKLGILSIVRVVAARKTPFNLNFYRMAGGVYPDKPNALRNFTAAMDPFNDSKESFFPFVLIGDVNGDNRSDLLLANGRKEMQVFPGVTGPDLFAGKAQEVKVAIPIDEQYTQLADLNRDGKHDLLMHHASKTKAHRVTILIAR